MESCLRGSKRNNNKGTTNHHKNRIGKQEEEDSYLQQQQQQQPIEEQELQELQLYQLQQKFRKQQQQQQQLQQDQLKVQHHFQVLPATTTTTIKPKFVSNCLQFPPPPNYPPPLSTTITTTSATMAGRNIKSAAAAATTTVAETTTATTATAINNIPQQQQQQQQQQSHMPVLIQHQHQLTHQLAQQQQQQLQQQQPQHLNLQLQQHVQTTINSLQQQINNLHIEMDSSRDTTRIMNMSHQLPHHRQHPNSHHQHHNQQQQHTIIDLNSSRSPTSSSSSTSTSINSANAMGISPCGRRGHVLPRYPDPDPDAIEICNEPKEIASSSNLTRRQHHHQQLQLQQQQQLQHHQHQHQQREQRQMNLEAESMHWPHTTTPHTTHDYSYAYYEPGAAMRHSNIPAAISPSISPLAQTLLPPPPNSMRALLSKGKKNKSLVSAATRHCYQTRYGLRNTECTDVHPLHTLPANMLLMHENFYEEISSATETRAPLRASGANSHSAGSLSQSLVEEELRRVQSRHRKILGELNLSVEAMLMPESPPPSVVLVGAATDDCGDVVIKEKPSVSVTASSGQPVMVGGVRLSASSADNICASSQLSEELPNNSQLGFCAADLDSGFSGSSGASYIGSLRIHKTNAALNQLKHEKRQGQTSSGSSLKRLEHTTNNSSNTTTLCPFPYATQSCRSFQRGAITTTRLSQEDDADTDAGFLTRASCGRRILNCAKLRAAEDPGPGTLIGTGTGTGTLAAGHNVINVGPPTESKAKSFWNRKGWRKLPGHSTSTSSINDTGLTGRFKFLLKRGTTYRKT